VKFDRAFLKVVLAVFGTITLLSWYPLAAYGTPAIVSSVVAAAVLSLLHLVSGYWAIEYSFDKPPTTFLKVVLGSMGVRLVVMSGAFVLLIKVYDMQVLPLMVALLFFYGVNLGLEIYYLQKKVKLKN
jgi:hypothetical protein